MCRQPASDNKSSDQANDDNGDRPPNAYETAHCWSRLLFTWPFPDMTTQFSSIIQKGCWSFPERLKASPWKKLLTCACWELYLGLQDGSPLPIFNFFCHWNDFITYEPLKFLFHSVPVSWIPAVNSSWISYSKRAFLLVIFTAPWDMKQKYANYPKTQVCKKQVIG